MWGDYANNLSDIVGDNFRYAKQVPVVLNAEFLTDSIPDNSKGMLGAENLGMSFGATAARSSLNSVAASKATSEAFVL